MTLDRIEETGIASVDKYEVDTVFTVIRVLSEATICPPESRTRKEPAGMVTITLGAPFRPE